MKSVLIFEPDESLAAELAKWLESGGFRTSVADSREAAQSALVAQSVSALVLAQAPGFDDVALLLCFRGTSKLPTIILGHDNSSAATRSALNLGADCYMSKPYSPREVLARIRSLTRRLASS